MKQQNQFLIVFLVLLGVALAGAGFYFFSSQAKYRAAMSEFDRQRLRLAALQSKSPFPNQENVDRIEASVSGYQKKVSQLQEGLLNFQKPLVTGMSESAFTEKLRDTVAEIRKLAGASGLTLSEEFYMGMPKYQVEFPRPDAVGLLDYQLQSIDNLMKILVAVRADELVDLKRAPLAIEADGYEPPEEQPPLEKFPLDVVFSGPHDAMKEFFNRVSNDEEFFYVIRFVRIESSMKDGPERRTFDSGFDLSDDEDEGFDLSGGEDGSPDYDAKMIMGSEKIRVQAVIDLVRVAELDMEVDSSDAEKAVAPLEEDQSAVPPASGDEAPEESPDTAPGGDAG